MIVRPFAPGARSWYGSVPVRLRRLLLCRGCRLVMVASVLVTSSAAGSDQSRESTTCAVLAALAPPSYKAVVQHEYFNSRRTTKYSRTIFSKRNHPYRTMGHSLELTIGTL